MGGTATGEEIPEEEKGERRARKKMEGRKKKPGHVGVHSHNRISSDRSITYEEDSTMVETASRKCRDNAPRTIYLGRRVQRGQPSARNEEGREGGQTTNRSNGRSEQRMAELQQTPRQMGGGRRIGGPTLACSLEYTRTEGSSQQQVTQPGSRFNGNHGVVPRAAERRRARTIPA